MGITAIELGTGTFYEIKSVETTGGAGRALLCDKIYSIIASLDGAARRR